MKTIFRTMMAVVMTFAVMSPAIAKKAAAPSQPVTIAGTYHNIGGCQVYESDAPDAPATPGQIFVKCPSNVTVREINRAAVDPTSSAAVAIMPNYLNLTTTGNNTWKRYDSDQTVANFGGLPSSATFFVEVAAGQPMMGASHIYTPMLVNVATGAVLVSARVYVCNSNSPVSIATGVTPFQTTGELFMTNTVTAPQTTPVSGAKCNPL